MTSRHSRTKHAAAALKAGEAASGPAASPSAEDDLTPAATVEAPADEAAAPTADVAAEAAARPASALDAQLATLEAELAEQKDKYLRLAAEYENFRKRATRDRQKAELEGMGLLIRGILDALDDLGRFAHVEPGSTDARTVQEGAEIVEKKLLKSLAGHGLEVVNPVGHAFDPAVHEAVTTTPATSEDEDHLIAQVFQVGYVFNGQLLRPARVVVKQWKVPIETASTDDQSDGAGGA